ncbi:Facilitated trehalose transporter Tret1 [Orchesella cincta]|uniref:Facilitated trehalose transporter Tret1 n=1 Tax=Orchesella cincta TaxID=48709 RepID=A0A1D2MZC4_ORCCI|nr:Facilitated trehalose transporter Tret1 [Orchesella cincta]
MKVAALCSCFIIGYTVEKIGRKLTSILMVIPFVIGYAIMASAQSVMMIYIGRFITGFSGGAYTVITSVYISEICSGIAFVYIVGAIVNWRITSIVCGVVPILHGVAMLFVPDTPRYLLSKGQTEKAAAALQWLRGAPSVQDIEPELKEIQSGIDEANNNTSGGSLLVGSTIKPCLMSVTAMAFQQLAGINAVIFFSVDIFKAAGSDIDPNVCAIIVGMTQAVGFAFAGILMNRFGRKPLFLFSEIGMCISLAALGVFYYLKEEKPDTAANLGWLPLVSLVMYMVTYCCGGICALGAAFAAFVLPETKGKTVEEIMRIFADKV